MNDNKTRGATVVYNLARLWFIFVFAGSVADAVSVALISVSLPISNHLSWSMLYVGQQMAHSELYGREIFYYSLVVSVLVAVPYLLAAIFSGKRYGWMRAGLILYSIDTVQLLFTLISSTNPDFLLFHGIALAIHIGGEVLIILALKQGMKIERFARRASERESARSFGGGSFNRVRTLCLIALEDVRSGSSELSYSLNGYPAVNISFGETKIIMIDGNHQRLTIRAYGCLPTEVAVPAGFENSTYTIRVTTINGTPTIVAQRRN